MIFKVNNIKTEIGIVNNNKIEYFYNIFKLKKVNSKGLIINNLKPNKNIAIIFNFFILIFSCYSQENPASAQLRLVVFPEGSKIRIDSSIIRSSDTILSLKTGTHYFCLSAPKRQTVFDTVFIAPNVFNKYFISLKYDTLFYCYLKEFQKYKSKRFLRSMVPVLLIGASVPLIKKSIRYDITSTQYKNANNIIGYQYYHSREVACKVLAGSCYGLMLYKAIQYILHPLKKPIYEYKGDFCLNKGDIYSLTFLTSNIQNLVEEFAEG